MFWYIFLTAGFLCFLHIFCNYNERARKIRKIPGPKDTFILGNAPALMRSSVEVINFLRNLAKENSGIYRLWLYPLAAVNIYNPDDIETIVSNMKFNEKSQIYRVLRPWLRDGLLISKGSKWQERRKILTPTFHFNILRQFSQVLEDNSQRFVESLKQVSGRPIDVVPIISEFTLNSICETAMGTKLSDYNESEINAYKDAIYNLGYVFYQRMTKIFYFFDFSFNLTPLSRKQDGYLKIVHGFTKKVIAARTKYIDKYGMNIAEDTEADGDTYVTKKKKTAMLDLLITAKKEGLIDDIGIQEEVDTFMFEGHDTTASGLTFCFMLLAHHQDVQEKIFTEMKEVLGDSKRSVTMEDLPKMKYLERCVKESLRLYPPVHIISRSLNKDVTLRIPEVKGCHEDEDKQPHRRNGRMIEYRKQVAVDGDLAAVVHQTMDLGNYDIPAGTFCHIHIYDLHRRPELFKNPEEFDPDRFLPENSAGRHPYAYIPFSAGPRNCIGQKFAMMEMKVAVAEVLREFTLEPVTHPEDIRIITDIVLRNDGPIKVTFVKRQ